MPDSIDTSLNSDVAKRDVNRLMGSVAKCLAANSPFINILRGGTFQSGVGDVVTSAVEMQAAPGDSLAVPTFTNDTALAGTSGSQEKSGKVDFSYRLEGKRGKGPLVNVKQAYGAFKSSYLSAEDSLRKLITQYINADTQAQLVIKSGTKFSCKAGQTLDQNIVGGTEADIGIDFATLSAPDAPLTFKCLHAIARHLKEVLFGPMFEAEGKGTPHFRFIGSSDIIESFRNEVGVQNVLLALTQGGYKLGENSVSAYSWETSPAYRGLAFGTTHRPLRFNTITDDMPVWLNPVDVVEDEDTNTAYSVADSDWLSSTYETGILIAEGSFERQLPERYVGEGSFKFAPQLCMGELDWHYKEDNQTNLFGDFGFHKYQITRAYKPLRPQHIIPIIYKRAQTDLGLTAI